MTAAKPTPGPWHVGDYGTNILDDKDELIADAGAAHFRTREERRANARFIAAAPELYEALVAVRLEGQLANHQHWDWEMTHGANCAVCEAQHKILTLVTAALRKAEGKEL